MWVTQRINKSKLTTGGEIEFEYFMVGSGLAVMFTKHTLVVY